MLSTEQQILEQIKKSESILITAPGNKNGDSIASSLAFFLFLKKMGKKADIIIEKDHINKDYSFLTSFSEIKDATAGIQKLVVSLDTTNTKVDQVKYVVEDNRLDFVITPKEGVFTGKEVTSCVCDYKYDLIISLGAAELDNYGKFYEEYADFFYKTPIINIDHESINEEFGQINLVQLTAVSISEILFNLFKSYNEKSIDEDTSTCLLAGMIIKTRSFKSQSVTPQSLEAAAGLISLGARRDEIITHLYRSRSLNVLKLWGRVLARLNSSLNDSLIWSILGHSDFLKTASREEDLQEVIDELIVNIPKAKVIVLIYETSENITKALLYSTKSIDVLEIAKGLNPTGAKNLAKISLNIPLAEAEKQIINQIEPLIKKILENE